MDQPYSFWADWLSKFHTAPELIQALWLIALSTTVLGVAWLVMRGLTQILSIMSRRHLVYGVYQDDAGRWMIYRDGGQTQELDWTHPPPEVTGRSHLIQGGFRRPE